LFHPSFIIFKGDSTPVIYSEVLQSKNGEVDSQPVEEEDLSLYDVLKNANAKVPDWIKSLAVVFLILFALKEFGMLQKLSEIVAKIPFLPKPVKEFFLNLSYSSSLFSHLDKKGTVLMDGEERPSIQLYKILKNVKTLTCSGADVEIFDMDVYGKFFHIRTIHGDLSILSVTTEPELSIRAIDKDGFIYILTRSDSVWVVA
jgi:hypothetical protein